MNPGEESANKRGTMAWPQVLCQERIKNRLKDLRVENQSADNIENLRYRRRQIVTNKALKTPLIVEGPSSLFAT
jgi:hypothetical protein